MTKNYIAGNKVVVSKFVLIMVRSMDYKKFISKVSID